MFKPNGTTSVPNVFAQRSFFAQRERVKLLSCPKKCYFHSPLELFCLTMTSQIESTSSIQYGTLSIDGGQNSKRCPP